MNWPGAASAWRRRLESAPVSTVALVVRRPPGRRRRRRRPAPGYSLRRRRRRSAGGSSGPTRAESAFVRAGERSRPRDSSAAREMRSLEAPVLWSGQKPKVTYDLEANMFRYLIKHLAPGQLGRALTLRPIASDVTVYTSNANTAARATTNGDESDQVNIKSVQNNNQGKASSEQLALLADKLVYHLPRFFTSPHPFNLYTKDVIFIDNVRYIRIEGLSKYAFRLALIKIYYALSYTSVKVELLNLVKHPEESCIKIRWRAITRPGHLWFILNFYKYHSHKEWKDGISTMHVNKDGRIYCHICDNIDVETDDTEIKKTIKSPLVSKGLNV